MLRRLALLPIFFILLQANTIAASSEIQSDKAMDIQAAFLIKFCSYVTWPEGSFSNPEDPVIVGILGRDPFGSKVDNIARSFKADGRNVEIRRFKYSASLGPAHILFISSSEAAQMSQITSELSGDPVLLVSNIPNFLEYSGMVNFLIVGKKIRFNISRTNSQKAGLTISSKLLRVAHEVK